MSTSVQFLALSALPAEKEPRYRLILPCVDTPARTYLRGLEKKIFLPLLGIELRLFGHSVRSVVITPKGLSLLPV